jgi:hypothetical protein
VGVRRDSFLATIYTDTRLTARQIAAHLAPTVHGSVSGASADVVIAERIDLEVTQFDEWPPLEPVDEEETFLYFPYQLDVFTDDWFDQRAVVADVAAVLGALDQLGVCYVTAADFEDELPRGGRSKT